MYGGVVLYISIHEKKNSCLIKTANIVMTSKDKFVIRNYVIYKIIGVDEKLFYVRSYHHRYVKNE